MNKTVIGIIVALLLLGGVGAAVVLSSDSEQSNNESSSSESMDAMEKDGDAMEKEDEVMEKHDDSMEKDGDAMEKDGESSMMKSDQRYVTLASYQEKTSEYSENNKVLFFHASWCSICQGIEKEINADSSRIPEGTVFIKTDFDSETELRQKYGVTSQYTFVQIDNDGNQIAKWSATSLDKAIAGIEV